MWTRFMDMHSGGSCKQKPYKYIYIEAPEEEAVEIFYNRFAHYPHWVACECCGPNYSVSEYQTLEEAQEYDGPDDGDMLVVPADEIKSDEKPQPY